VVAITGMLQAVDHREKVSGFKEAFPSYCEGGKVVDVIEGHESEDELFQKCYGLLGREKHLEGVYVSTVNCLPVCRAISAYGLSGKVRLITTDLFREMVPYFEKGTISASIYQRPYVQGRTAVQLLGDHFAHGTSLPPRNYLEPHIVMRSNLYLFRETAKLEPASNDLAPQIPQGQESGSATPQTDFR